ncbi:hypothetical protein B1H10_00760 [candidate division KSB1 bacterium 4484_188]|nr:MAG: hypothetical protein B1H10_00760 [candidate division KSB1 bacterium 4484_188]
MLKPKKKITKRDLKEDKFVTFTLKARDYIETNMKMLVRAGIVVLLIIIAVSMFIHSKRNATIRASELLGEAQLANSKGNSMKADSLLKVLVTEYDGVTAAGQGCFLLAKMYWEQNDFDNAQIYFKKYLDEYGGDDLLTAGALAGYADCLIQKGQIAEAAKYYEKAGLLNKELPEVPSFLYSAARAYLEAKDFQKAKSLAEKIVQEYQKSEYKSKAEILLNMAKLES